MERRPGFTRRRAVLVAAFVGVIGVGALLGAYALTQRQTYPCGPQSTVQKTNLPPPVQFGAVTEYSLPANRSPNAITAAPDGSVWFGELGVPGVGHLFQNGTLAEYRWPYTYPTSSGPTHCSDWSDTWGIAVWNGMVWGTYADGDQIIGVNPSNGAAQTIQLKTGSFPYTLTVGPDNDLWFTQLSFPSQIGKIDPSSHQITYYPLPNGKNASSAYIDFTNSTLAYVLSIFPYSGGGQLFSFNPSASSTVFTQVGMGLAASESSGISTIGNGPSTPTSVAVGEGGVWLTEHSESDMSFYSFATGQWSLYPTSLVTYIPLTLPYFDVSNGTMVWFNEHYGNKIAEICCNRTSLTEYSVSDPAVTNIDDIPNTITIALGDNRVWFTQWTGNEVGFINTDYTPPFSLSLSGSSTVTVQRGATAQVQLSLTGKSAGPLDWQFSDSEQPSGVPKNITFSNPGGLGSLNGPLQATITVTASSDAAPGQYTALITLTDGLIYRSVYLAVTIS